MVSFDHVRFASSPKVLATKPGALMFTAAECRAKALEKIVQAKQDKRHRRKLISAAEAWLFLAERLDQSDRFAAAYGIDGDSEIDYRTA